MASYPMSRSQQQRRHCLAYVPWLPILLSLSTVITASVWYFFASLALLDTKVIAALITIPVPHAFSSTLPAILAASLAFIILQAVAVLGLYTWRSLQLYRSAAPDSCGTDSNSSSPRAQRARKSLSIASGALLVLQYGITLWFVFMLAISMLWYGGGMVAARATTDAVSTMSVVDETLPRLIQNAMNIDPRKSGYLVHVNGRDVNIGTSSCSLFCFTLARAMLADTIDCTCNEALAGQLMPPGNVTADITDAISCGAAPVMCSINQVAFDMYKRHMKPAMVGVVLTVMALLGLLSLVSGTHARTRWELQRGSSLSRASSTDADMRISNGSDNDPAFKVDPADKAAV